MAYLFMNLFFRTHARPGNLTRAPVGFLPAFRHSAFHRHIRMTGPFIAEPQDSACPDGRGAVRRSRCQHPHTNQLEFHPRLS